MGFKAQFGAALTRWSRWGRRGRGFGELGNDSPISTPDGGATGQGRENGPGGWGGGGGAVGEQGMDSVLLC